MRGGSRSSVTARGSATRSVGFQIAEQTVHPPGPVGAVGLFRQAVGLEHVADLPAGADDLEGDAARSELAMEIAQHLCARQIDKGEDERPQTTSLVSRRRVDLRQHGVGTVSALM